MPSDRKFIERRSSRPGSIEVGPLTSIPSTDPPKEKERSGRSYRSKRKEREQQRGEQ